MWCLTNTTLVVLVAFAVFINSDRENNQDRAIDDLKLQMKTIENQQRDTIVVNITNDVKIPSKFSIDIDYPNEYINYE